MKQFILAIAMLLAAVSPAISQKSVNQLINKMKKDKEAFAFTIPGWLIRTGMNHIFEDDVKIEKGYQDISKGIKQLRLLVIDRAVDIDHAEMQAILAKIKEKDKYEDYATVRHEKEDVHVMVREDKDKIKNLLVLVKGEDEFVILHFNTNITYDELKNAALSFNNKEKNSILDN